MRSQAVFTGVMGAMVVWALSACATGGGSLVVKDTDLPPYTIVDGIAIKNSLTGKKGDPAAGRKVAAITNKGNCLACHELPIPEEQFHGKVGPNLTGVANRMTEGQIRMRVVNPKRTNPATIMPSFYKVDGLANVRKGFEGKPMLSGEEIEDLVAYLSSLK